MLTFFKELASYSYIGETLVGIGDSDPFYRLGKLRVRNTKIIQQISEGNFYRPTLFSFHGDHDRLCFTCQNTPGSPLDCSRDPSPATSRPPPGLEGQRRRKGKRPPIEPGTGLGVGLERWPLRTLPGLLRSPPPLTRPGACGDGGGGGDPGTLIPTRNPPACLFVGLHGRDREATRLLPYPGRGAEGSPRRPSTSGSAATSAAKAVKAPFPGRRGRELAAAPRWPLRGLPGCSQMDCRLGG